MIPVTATAMEKVDTSANPYVAVYMEQLKTAGSAHPLLKLADDRNDFEHRI